MAQPGKEEQIKNLIEKTIKYYKDKDNENGKKCANEILEIDPDSLDGHILASLFEKFISPEKYEHLKFVMDRDIKHEEPFELRFDRRNFIEEFLVHLKLKSYQAEKENKLDELNEEIISYSTKVLKEGIPIPEIHDFVEVLLENSQFDDVIDIGYFLTEHKKGKDIGLPGLDYGNKHGALDACYIIVMSAYFESGRYEEGCKWIHHCVKEQTDDHYRWYLLGETLAWLGYPEETARAWMIAVDNGNFTVKENDSFELLSSLVCDPDYQKKRELFGEVFDLKNEIKPEQQEAYEEIQKLVNSSLRDSSRPLPSRNYIEKKLGMKLKERGPQRRYRAFRSSRLFIPTKKSSSPVVQEVMETIEKQIEESNKKALAKQNGNKTSASSLPGKKQKVTVGSSVAPTQYAQTLVQFGINITDLARKGDIPPIVGRDREIDRMVRVLARSEKNNPVLLGEAGVGKTAVVYGLAQRIISADVPDSLKSKTIVELNVGAIVAGTMYRGDFEKRMENIIKEMRLDPDKILFIDEFHTLIGAGDSRGKMDASNILKPALSAGELRLIGATTSSEFSRSIERDAAFERRFSPIWLHEITPEITLSVLKARMPLWEKHHKIKISDETLHTAINMADQHIKHRRFPDKAIDLIDEACALARIETAQANNKKLKLTTGDIKKVCDQWTGSSKLPELNVEFIDDIEQQLNTMIIGHEIILKELSVFVADEKLGLTTSKLPRVIYFYGVPDTGKTECARALSKVLWPDEKERVLYIDMELLNDHSDLNRLMGAPRGTIGSEEGGRLSIHLKQHPYTVVCLHNFHKAHEHITRFFANLFREGSFSDGLGQNIFAGNAIFILTASLHNKQQKIGYGKQQGETSSPKTQEVPGAIKNLDLAKEVLHFVKDYYFFDELSETELRGLVKRKIENIKGQPNMREFKPKFDDAFIDEIVAEYLKLPQDSRNLKGLLQRCVYEMV